MREFEKNHLNWVKELIPLLESDVSLVFGFQAPSHIQGGPTRPLNYRIKHAQKLERDLIQLCRQYQFDVEDPYLDLFPSMKYLKGSKIGARTSELFISILAQNRQDIAELEKDIAAREGVNQRAKKGPPKIPAYFAEHVLAGLCLHQDSREGLVELRQFIEPGGGLQDWLNNQELREKNFKHLVYNFGENDNIRRWASSKKLAMRKIVLSHEIRKEVKTLAPYRSQLKVLEERVLKRAEALKSMK